LDEGGYQIVAHLYYGWLVSTAITEVWGAEDGDDSLLVVPRVSIHHELVSPSDHRQVVSVKKPFSGVQTRIQTPLLWDSV